MTMKTRRVEAASNHDGSIKLPFGGKYEETKGEFLKKLRYYNIDYFQP